MIPKSFPPFPTKSWGGFIAALVLAACAATPPPGVQVAVAFDRTGERGSFASGLADPATGRRAAPPKGRSGFTRPEEAMILKSVSIGQHRP